ncbi:MAG TPA: DnaA regulatory inactivator Hda [Aquabacterium sp.]|nr:DnaA regulatory inactivator Hda [Aquabacterium sp.]
MTPSNELTLLPSIPAYDSQGVGMAAADGVMRQIPLDLGPAVQPGLEDFIEAGNEQVLAWLRNWPQSAELVGPAYIWGPAGSGKSHLLRALVEKALELQFGVIWLRGPHCQIWDAPDPEGPTLAVMDDCELFDAHQQHLAFNLFIESSTSGRARLIDGREVPSLSIVAAGNVPPVDLPVRDDLRTRLGWGVTFALHPLDEAGIRGALQREAARRGIDLGDGVVSYLLTRYSRDLGFLMGLLDRLDRFALAEHRMVTVPLLKQMLALETA